MPLVVHADATWNASAGGTWSNPVNWVGAVPNSAGSSATFLTAASTSTVVLDGAFTVGNLTFNANSIYRLAASTPNGLTMDSGSASAASIEATNAGSNTAISLLAQIQLNSNLTIDADATYSGTKLTVTGPINGSNTITKTGAGQATLDGSNSAFTGQVIVTAGTLQIANAAALGSSANASDNTIVQNGATLALSNARGTIVLPESISVTGGTITGGSFSGAISLSGGTLASAVFGGPISLNADSVLNAGAITGVISGSANLTSIGLSNLSGANTYTGITTLSSGTLTVSSTSGLGSSAGATNILGGILTLNVPTADAITIAAGARINFSGGTPHSTSITSPGATIGMGIGSSLSSNIILNGGTTTITNYQSGSTARTMAGTSGVGDLTLGDSSSAPLVFTKPLTHDGDLYVHTAQVTFSGTASFQGDVTIDNGGSLTANVNSTLGSVALINGTLATATGSTLTIARSLQAQRGTINANISGITDIAKTTINVVTAQNLGNYSGTVHVQAGTLQVTGSSGLGTTAGATYVTPGAALVLVGVPSSETVYLQNSTGFGADGALSSFDSAGVGGTFAGTVHLGNIGSVIGTTNNSTLRVTGSIQDAGSLTALSVNIAAAGQTYTGPTIVQQGKFRLSEQGALSTTSSVSVENEGILMVEPSPSSGPIVNRIADNIPITLRGGTFDMNVTTGSVTNETVGTLTVAKGQSTFSFARTSGISSTGSGNLHADSFLRLPGATLLIDDPNFHISGDNLIFTNAPPLINGILAPWAITHNSLGSGTAFLTYTASGGIDRLATSASSIDAGSTTNVLITGNSPITAAGDREVNALNTFSSSDINLNAHLLTLGTGGLIFAGPTHILTGQLLPGSSSGGELIIHTESSSGTRFPLISSDIVDRPGGPTTSLTKAGNSLLQLSGNNTYTGTTVVDFGTLDILSPSAIPQNGVLDMAGGQFIISYAATAPIHFSTVKLRGGMIGGGGDSSLSVTADEYDIESGQFLTALAGAATLTKTSINTATLNGDNAAYSGNIIVNEGVLQLGDGTTATFPNALGSGLTRVDAAATLIARSATTNGNIQLNGGRLVAEPVDGSTSISYTGPFHVTANSTLLPSTSNMIFTGDSLIDRSTTLLCSGPLQVSFTGNLQVNGIVQEGAAGLAVVSSGTGGIVAAPTSGNRLSGQATFADLITIASGGILAPGDQGGAAIGALSVGAATFDAAGIFEWQISDANGAPGTGWDFLNIATSLQTPSSGFFTVKISTLNGLAPANFNPSQLQDWQIVSANALLPTDLSRFLVDASGFQGALPGSAFSVVQNGNSMFLQYDPSPVPEPIFGGSIGIAIASMFRRDRRKRKTA